MLCSKRKCPLWIWEVRTFVLSKRLKKWTGETWLHKLLSRQSNLATWNLNCGSGNPWWINISGHNIFSEESLASKCILSGPGLCIKIVSVSRYEIIYCLRFKISLSQSLVMLSLSDVSEFSVLRKFWPSARQTPGQIDVDNCKFDFRTGYMMSIKKRWTKGKV